MPLPQSLRRALTLGLVIALAGAVSACGRRGAPEFIGQEAAETAAGNGTSGLVPTARGKPSESVKPQRSFVLDPLL